MTPRIGSACSGYGGLDRGLMAVVGGSVAWHVEHDKHAARVLEARFPGVPNYGDVTTTDWTQVEPINWFVAGYPCQPFSTAGKRLGDADDRHVWPAVADAIRHLRPRNVLLENVAGHLVLGFGAVLGDLAALGYDTRWLCVRASDAGAPHRRERVFIVASDTDRAGLEGTEPAQGRELPPRGGSASADADRGRREQRHPQERVLHLPDESDPATWGPFWPAISRWERITGRAAPAPLDSRGRLNVELSEWMMGLPRGWVTDTGISRTQQLKIIGNGVVPQQAELAVRTLLSRAEAVAA